MYNLTTLLDEFQEKVNQGVYKKISYEAWRQLRDYAKKYNEVTLCNNYVANEIIIQNMNCGTKIHFSQTNNDFGKYLMSVYNKGLYINVRAASSSLTESISNISLSASNVGASLKKLSDSINRKENDNMNKMFKNFDFGSCSNDNVKVSMYGVAVKNATGSWVSYDSKSGNVVDVDDFNFDAKYLYKMPVAIKDIKAGDTIIHCRKPVFVIKNENGKISCIDPASAEEKIVLPVKNIFGFDFAVKIINLFEGMEGFEAPSADQPFGNNLWMYMMLEDKGSMGDLLPFLWFSNKGNDFNPLMLLALSNDKTPSSDLLPLFLLSQNNIFGQTK